MTDLALAMLGLLQNILDNPPKAVNFVTQVTSPCHTHAGYFIYLLEISFRLLLASRQNRGFGNIQLPRFQFSKSSGDVIPRVTSQMPDDDDDARFHDNVRHPSPRDQHRRMTLTVSKPRYAVHLGPSPLPPLRPYISPPQSHWWRPHSMHPLGFTPSITLSACDLLHSLSVAAKRGYDPTCAPQNILNPNHPTYLYPYPYSLPTTTPHHLPVPMVTDRLSPGNVCHVTRSSDDPLATSESNATDTGSENSSWRRCDDVTEKERKLLASNRTRKTPGTVWRPY